MSTEAEKQVNNGVNVDALLGAREALTEAPEAAKFKWRATLQVDQRHAQPLDRRGLLRARRGAEAQDRVHLRRRPSRRSSRPRTRAPRRSRCVLAGLAGCLTAGIAAVAQNARDPAALGTATLEGGMDIQGILGIDSDVRNGFDGIKVTYDIDADAIARRHQGARRAVAEALGRVRHHHQPDQRHGRGASEPSARRTPRHACARPPSSSAPATPGWR